MKKYKIYHSSRFDRELSKFDRNFLDRIDKIEDKIVDNPFTGNPLNVKWFREKRVFGKYRVYFLVYEDLLAVTMVGISVKKDQEKIINTIRLLFSLFRKELDLLIEEGIT